ncbi:uncharacterized protein LOC110454336 [Mizuhopecten yessoensis]|uniref:uncharacterized protein LOC110454336 n=1 Tax=Mizuhopecten yessoensis TaxID=6573 RepID=UPI000B45EB30|nr:uncharacterized protein LOC110454336 [Mizuhopecten yessoensis]
MHVEYEIIKAIPLSKGKPSSLDMSTEVTETKDGLTNVTFTIAKDAIIVAKGSVTNGYHAHKHIVPIEDVRIRTGKHMEREELYSELAKYGYKYGPPVQVLEAITFDKDECTGFIHLTEEVAKQVNQTSFHPAILDAMLHSSALNFLSNQKETSYKIYPIRVGSVAVLRPFEKRMMCYTQTIQKVYDRIITNIILTRLDGLVLAEVKEIEHRIMDGSIGVNDLAYQIVWTVEDISNIRYDTTDDLNQRVTICYDDNSVLNTLRTVYPRGESFQLRDVAADPAPMLSSTDTNDVDTVVFVPDSNVGNQRKTGDEIFYKVCENCEAFLNTMKTLKDMDKTIVIVTENTQASGPGKDTNRNVFGAELWGFTRSLRQEGTKCRMILIDVQPSIASEVKTLYKTIQVLTSGQVSSFTECLIADGQLHSNFLQRRPQSGLQNEHRILSTDTNIDLQLRSTTTDIIENPFFIPGDSSCEAEKSKISLSVDEICIHSPNEFRITELDSSLKKTLWSDYKDGYPVIGLEFQGTLHDSKTANENPKQLVACYPTKVGNRISVPEQCVCDRASLPMYTPGLIITSMLMWSITQRVKRNSTVCIVTDSDPSDDAAIILLCDMLSTVKHSQVRIVSIDTLNAESKIEHGVFVILEKYSHTKSASVLRPGNTIIGLDDVLSCLSNQVIQLSSKQIKVHVITKINVFEETNVTKTFPKVKRWLTRWQKRHHLSENAQKSLQLKTIKLSKAKSGGKSDMNTKAMGDKLIQNNATYVVVGGLTGLGWEIVKWLGFKKAGVVVTLSRKGLNSEMKEQLQNAMDIHKYKIVPMSCNVANYADVEKTFSAIKSQFPNHPIKGIFQGAGVLRDTRIETMTMQKFREVLQPKVLGTWNLHLVSQELLLDYFIMHSSTTSVFGNAGQTNYGAANSFMDSLAMYRRANGLPGQTINWGALAVGMASDETIRSNLEAQGYYLLETDKIRECLMDSLIQNPCQIVYGLFDWTVIGTNPAMMRTSTVNQEETAVTSKSGQRRVDNVVLDIAKFSETSFEDQRQTLAQLLLSSISRVLSIDEGELEEKQNLLGLGMESQKAVELIQVVKEATGCRLPVAYILSPDYTIGMLIDFAHSNIIDNFNKEATGNSETKEDLYGSPSWMQKFYIDMHENNSHDSSLWFSIDFRLGRGLSNVDLWRAVLRWTTIKNPELRTVFRPTNQQIRFGMKNTVLDPEDAKIDIRVVDSCVLTREWTDQDIKNYCTFDITTDPPIRVLYGNTGKKNIIRFIMSHVTFDLQSFLILLPQFRSHFLTYFLKRDVNVEPVEIPDLPVLMEERMDAERFYLEDFWRGELKKIRDVPSLVGPDPPVLNSQKTEKVSLEFPKELVDKINSNNHGVTAPILLFSLYQILLHKMTCVTAIPVVLTVDMRRHFPEFIDRIFLGTNYIPVITEFKDTQSTLRECISICASQVTLTSASSLYPYMLITKNEAYTQNSFRHFFNVREISFQGDRNAQYADYYMENAGYSTDFLNEIETALNVVTDHQAGSMELVLSFDPAIVSSSTAKRMLDDLLLLACVTAANTDFQLNEIPLECCGTDVSDKLDHHLSTVRFSKETLKGWEHPAQLKVGSVHTLPQITWSNPESNAMSPDRTIPISCVLDADIQKLSDTWCLIIQTRKRQYCFKASDFIMVRAWKARIRKLMSRSKRSSKKMY